LSGLEGSEERSERITDINKVVLGNLEGQTRMGRTRSTGNIILRCVHRNKMEGYRMNSTASG
jgi:hypothetical protein